MSDTWWQTFLDADPRLLPGSGATASDSRAALEVDFFVRALELNRGDRVLDAPCGYGRVARLLAERGMNVLGVDQSQELLDRAEQTRGSLAPGQLRYVRHNLLRPLSDGGFDAALNVFSSLGYGDQEDDLAVLRTLWAALRPGGAILVDTVHRDTWAARLSPEGRLATRLPDGTLFVQEPRFDVLSGRAEISYFWQGPSGGGQKRSSVRIYTVTELVQLLERAGFRFRRLLQSPTGKPFEAKGTSMGGRVAIIAQRA